MTLTGENDFGLRTELDKLVVAFLAEHGEMTLERLDGEDASFEKMQEALQSLPFLAARKMVVLRGPSANKQFVENAERLLTELPETTDVILVEPKLDKRSSYYKFLKKTKDFREFVPLDANGLARWLVQRAKDQGGSLNSADANFLVDRIGANQHLLSNELEKLLLYDLKITQQTIGLLTEPTPQSKIFDLLDAAFAGRRRRAMELYEEQRALKVEALAIIAMLAWQLHILALIKAAGQRTPDQIARDAKINPFVVRKSSAIARKLTLSELKTLVADLLEIDIRLKHEPIDPNEALRNYLLALANGS